MALQSIKDALTKSFLKFFPGSQGLPVLASHWPTVDWQALIEKFLELRNLCITASLMPLFWIIFDIAFDRLGANPTQALHIRLGDWSLRFLCITLAITPIQKITRWPGMANYRQLFGLLSFFYASLHLLAYLTIDHALAWDIIVIDVLESSYIWFGIMAYSVILALAITSPKSAKKRMGKSWKKLHRFIYPASVAVIVHYFWQLKGNLLQPVFYMILIFLLLAFRAANCYKNRQLSRLMIPKGRPIDDG